MVKFLLGVLSGILLVFFAFGALLLLAVLAAGDSSPGVAADSVLQVRLSGQIPEHIAEDVTFGSLQGRTPTTLLTVLEAVDAAAEDDRIKALRLDFAGVAVGWAKAQELRWAIERFRDSGKPVYAYLTRAGMMDYYIASAADDLRAGPENVLDIKGLRAEVAFYKGLFDKLGVDVEMERIGRFKSAAEPYSRTDMSDEFRLVIDQILDGYLTQFSQAVAEGRGLETGAVRSLLDDGPYLPQQALDAGLIDGLAYPDEVEALIAEAIEVDEPDYVRLGRYVQSGAVDLQPSSSNRVAVLYGVGAIMSSSGGMFGADGVLAADAFNRTVERIREDDSIDAVLLRIDSPGGDAIASDDMWRELNRLAEEKPVVVSMSDVAASGGYYMAMIDDAPVVAYPGTITGSIGVFFGKVNLRGLYDKIGITKEIITRGRFAAIDSDYRPLGEEGREKLREGIEHVYSSFVSKVADARGEDYDAIHEVAQGRVWIGTQALDNGLVDELGGFSRALELTKEIAEIDADEEVSLVVYPRTRNLLEVLFDDGSLSQTPTSLESLLPELTDVRGLPALLKGGTLALSPYSLTVR